MTIDINGDVIDEITIDGEFTEEVTVDGEVVFQQSPIPDSALTQDLVAWYRFEDGDARDYASNTVYPNVTWGDSTAYDGTINSANTQQSGGVTDFENGSNSGCIDMTSNGYVEINGAATALQGEPETTQMVWVNWNSDPNDGNDHGFIDSDSPNDFPNFYINDGDNGPRVIFGNANTAASFNFNTSEWYHIAFSYSSSNGIKVYVDSQLVTSTSSTSGDIPTDLDDYAIGAKSPGDGSYSDAVFDDVRIYNRALTASEVGNIYNATKP